MNNALNSRNDPKLSLWSAKSSTLGTTDRRSRENISAKLKEQLSKAICWTSADLRRIFCMWLWYNWQSSSLGAEWRAMHSFQTYFCGAKFPMEATIEYYDILNNLFGNHIKFYCFYAFTLGIMCFTQINEAIWHWNITNNQKFTWYWWRHVPDQAVGSRNPLIMVEPTVDYAEQEGKAWKTEAELRII